MTTLPSYLLDRQLSDKEIADITRKCLKTWEKLYPYLGLNEVDVEGIKRIPDYEEQRREVLLKWRKQKGSGATFRALIKAARDADNINLADNLEDMLRNQISGTMHICSCSFIARWLTCSIFMLV